MKDLFRIGGLPLLMMTQEAKNSAAPQKSHPLLHYSQDPDSLFSRVIEFFTCHFQLHSFMHFLRPRLKFDSSIVKRPVFCQNYLIHNHTSALRITRRIRPISVSWSSQCQVSVVLISPRNGTNLASLFVCRCTCRRRVSRFDRIQGNLLYENAKPCKMYVSIPMLLQRWDFCEILCKFITL